MALLLMVLGAAGSPHGAGAQPTGTIAGLVETADGEALPGANVRLIGTQRGDVTDASGRFALTGVPSGTYTVEGAFIGYESARADVTVEAGATVRVTLTLSERPVVLDGLVVTSQKRLQAVQEVPVAITAYEGDFLADVGIQEFDKLSAYVPGLEVQIQSVNNPGFVVRGITSDNGDSRIEPRVSVFQDGVSISKSRGSVVELFDIERVEVLKGPQGTLFGRGAQIGAVHIIQNKARNTRSGRLEVGTGNFNERYITGHVNAPLVDNRLFGRVAAIYNRRDGFIENQTGDALNGKNTVALRTSLRWLPTDRTVVDAIVNVQRDTPPGTSFKSGAFAPPNGTVDPHAAAAMGADPVLQDDELFIDRTVWGATLLVDHALGAGWTLDGITAYRAFDSLERFDADGTPAPALQFDEDAEGRQFSQEVRLTYEDAGRFSGFVGSSFFWEDGSQRVPFRTDERSFIALLNPDVPLLDENGQPVLVPAIPDPATGASIPLKESHEEAYTNFGTTTAVELFADGTWEVTEQLAVTAGLRGTFEDVTGAYEVTNSDTPGRLGSLLGAAPNNLFAPTDGRPERTEQFWSAVGRLAADYALTDATTVFGTVARGRRPNVINVDAAGSTVLDSEIVWSYELGTKGLLADGRLEYTANGFYYDYSNFQTNVVELEDGELVTETRDSGEATAFGAETSIRAALTGGLSVFANYGFIDASFDETDADGNEQELAGNRFRLTPKHSVSVGASLEVPLRDQLEAFVRPDYTWKSKVYFEEDNDEAISQDAYGLLNLRVGLSFADQRIELEGFAQNLLDRAYIIDAGNTGGAFGIPTFIAGAPRLYGLRLTGRF